MEGNKQTKFLLSGLQKNVLYILLDISIDLIYHDTFDPNSTQRLVLFVTFSVWTL